MRYTSALVLASCDSGSAVVGDAPATADDPHPTSVVTGTEDCPAITSATAAEGVQPLEERITVTLDGPAEVYTVCTSPDEPEEQILVESAGAATSHALVVRGLLGSTDYTCTVRATCGGASAEASFTSGVPAGVPQLTVTRDPSLPISGAYTLFSSQPGCDGAMLWLGIADPEGRLRWTYPVATDLVSDMDAAILDPHTIHMGGGWGLFDQGQPNRGVFRDIDLSGEVLLEREQPDFGLGFNHHSQRLDDGRYLNVTGSFDYQGGAQWNGIGVEVWDPVDGVTFTWDSQPLVDAGLLDPPPIWDPLPYHANAAEWRTDSLGDALWLSIYGKQQIWRIDRATGDRTLVFGHDGDFSLVDTNGAPLDDAEYPFVQHGPDWQDDRLLVYDNGQGRPGGDYSRVAEYRLDLEGRVATLLWSWTEPGWDDPIVGDADYLPNGSVLVTQGFNTCFDPFDQDVSEIVELVPPDQVAWRLTWPDRSYTVYRSQRYDGCDVFDNARYCSAVADRIAELDR